MLNLTSGIPYAIVVVVLTGGREMYAIVATGGKQYKVSVGDRIKVEKLVAEPGAQVELGDVLMVGDGEKVEVGQPKVENAKVIAQVVAHGAGDKVVAFKKKRRKKYRRKVGHRQEYTELEIKEFKTGA